jgi:hypothetical protein
MRRGLPIRTKDQLVARLEPGQTRETVDLEFKSRSYRAKKSGDEDPPKLGSVDAKEEAAFEWAKDCAAMANAAGGVIVLGAMEQGGNKNTFGGFTSVNDAEAEKKWLEGTLVSRAFPHPRVEYVRLEADGGAVVLVINIQPSAELVCVKRRNHHALEFYRRGTEGNQPMDVHDVIAWNPKERAGRIRFEAAMAQAGVELLDGSGSVDGMIALGVFWVGGTKENILDSRASFTVDANRSTFSAKIRGSHVVEIPWSVVTEAWAIGKSVSVMLSVKVTSVNDQHLLLSL